ncbi:MAG TPA: hypothetical protein VGS19_00125 [Streptosporangiaceae bacterium]|nr:hypothetical protein [Streptosporangiaceae bacterium]
MLIVHLLLCKSNVDARLLAGRLGALAATVVDVGHLSASLAGVP